MAEIKPLPEEVACQIKSSTIISTLGDVVLGLFQNSLDAQATVIEVSVDFSRGCCTVEDNGFGILPADFMEDGGLGKVHHSSKVGSALEVHGKDGIFLSAVAALSVLHIVSRERAHSSTNGISFHRSRPITRLCPVPDHQAIQGKPHGTRVVVQDLFGSMPVRVKQRPLGIEGLKVREREWHKLCKVITGHLLAWGVAVSVTMHATDRGQTMRIKASPRLDSPGAQIAQRSQDHSSFNLDLIRTILVQGGHVDYSQWPNWMTMSARTKHWTIRGVVSLDPAPSKALQFICIGKRYICPNNGSNVLYEEVNRLFESSNFGDRRSDTMDQPNIETQQDSVHMNLPKNKSRRTKSTGKGVDRWPMFFMRIEQSLKEVVETSETESGASMPREKQETTAMLEILQALVTKFLQDQGFRPRKLNRAKKELSMAVRCSSESGIERKDSEEIPLEARTCGSSSSERFWRNGSEMVLLPKPSERQPKRDGSHSTFSTWSRIKVGTRSRSRKDMLQQRGLVRSAEDKVQSPESLTTNELGRAVQNDGKIHGLYDPVPEIEPTHTPLQLHENPVDVVSWKDPVSKDIILVNPRNGMVIERPRQDPNGIHSTRTEALGRPSHNCGHIASRSNNHSKSDEEAESWVEAFLKTWSNPIFNVAEEGIPRISLDDPTSNQSMKHGFLRNSSLRMDQGFESYTMGKTTKLDKKNLKEAIVIGQVDSKFILISLHVEDPINERLNKVANGDDLLVLVDQHAADERVRVESLLASLCSAPSHKTRRIKSSLGLFPGVETLVLADPLVLKFRSSELNMLRSCAPKFAKWGVLYDILPFPSNGTEGAVGASSQRQQTLCRLVINTLPETIAERCRVERQQLEELIRSEGWKMQNGSSSVHDIESTNHGSHRSPDDWPAQVHDCPQGILDMISSRSCRSAIMFNDKLSTAECRDLIGRLAACHFPFHCAHGRPSMVPIVNLEAYRPVGHKSTDHTITKADEDVSFLKMWPEWERKIDSS